MVAENKEDFSLGLHKVSRFERNNCQTKTLVGNTKASTKFGLYSNSPRMEIYFARNSTRKEAAVADPSLPRHTGIHLAL